MARVVWIARRTGSRARLLACLVALVAAVAPASVLFAAAAAGIGDAGGRLPAAAFHAAASSSQAVDQREAEPAIERAPLKARRLLEAIQQRHGEPLPGYVGGRVFHNRERKLPPGRYREYDVNPRLPGRDRGPERLVIEQKTGKAYYTGDHYRTFVPLN